MIKYDTKQKALIVTGVVTLDTLLDLSTSYFSYSYSKNRLTVNKNIIIEENATLNLSGANIGFNADYISIKDNGSLLLGSPTLSNTNIILNDCGVYAYASAEIITNNVEITSTVSWDLTITNKFNLYNTTINFEIVNNSKLNMVIENLTCTGNGKVISLADNVIYTNLAVNTPGKPLVNVKSANKNIYLYNPTIVGEVPNIASNTAIPTGTTVNVIVRGSHDFPTYGIENIANKGNVVLTHELLLKGKFIAVSGNTVDYKHNGTYDIMDNTNAKIGILVVADGIINQYVPYYLNKKFTFPLTIGNNLFSVTKDIGMENIFYVGLDNNLKPIDNILIERMINNMNVEINNNHRDITNLLHHMVETSGKPIKVTPPITINTCGGSKIII